MKLKDRKGYSKKVFAIKLGALLVTVAIALFAYTTNAFAYDTEAFITRAGELKNMGLTDKQITDQLAEEFYNSNIGAGNGTGGIDGKYLDGTIAPNGILAGTQSHSHDYKETGRTAATCTEEGKITYTCDCGKTKTETISKVEHDYQQSEEINGTCLEIGKIKFTCNNCGDSYDVETEYAPHNYIPSDESTQPTCTEDGMQIMTCSVCNDKNTTTIPALGHEESPVATLKTAPKCETEGLEQYLCTRCNNVLREEVLLATGHEKSTELIVEKEPSIIAEGTGVYKCTVCDTVLETTTIPQKDFPYVVVGVGVVAVVGVVFIVLCKRGKK